MYYTVFYLLFQVFIFGIVLSILQMDLFTAFLWLGESVIIFISILLIFYLNVYGNVSFWQKSFYLNKVGGLFFLLFLNFYYVYCFEFEFTVPFFFDNFNIYDFFYDDLQTTLLNDFYGLYLNFFYLNSLPYLLVGYLLLISSVICVNLNIVTRLNKVLNYSSFFSVFDFFREFSKFIFLRKQNLVDQFNAPTASRFFKKKKMEIVPFLIKKKKKLPNADVFLNKNGSVASEVFVESPKKIFIFF